MSAPASRGSVVVGVTGASGSVYAQKLIAALLAREHPVDLIVSLAGRRVVNLEIPCAPGKDPWGDVNRHLLRIHSEKDFGAPFCSGSHGFRGMVVIPASMGTIGAIAGGLSINAIHRGADVALKERRPLVLVPRETPLSAIHLENLLRLARAGAIVLPPSPAYYQKPRTVDDIVDFVVSRVLDALAIPNDLFPRWGGVDSEDPGEEERIIRRLLRSCFKTRSVGPRVRRDRRGSAERPEPAGTPKGSPARAGPKARAQRETGGSEPVRGKERGRGDLAEPIVEPEPTKHRAGAAGRSQDGVLKQLLNSSAVFFEAIKVSHSVFALPFAVAAAFMAAGGVPDLDVLAKVILACILARTAAMAFNRFVDAPIDAANPRTAGRAVPAGKLPAQFMLGAALAASAAFIAVAAWINPLCFKLSPVALLVLLGYSYTKRFTSLSHLVLGAALGLSPLGAWIAVRNELALPPVILGLAVMAWTGGFDIIYACQDHDFDGRAGLHSVPRRLGVRGALISARVMHVLTVALLALAGIAAGYATPYFLGTAAVAALLVYEHSLVSASDLSRINTAFFTVNGVVSLFFMSAVILEVVS